MLLLSIKADEKNKIIEEKCKIIKFPCISTDTDTGAEEQKQVSKPHKSTKMECLYTKEEILAVYNIFKERIDVAKTIAKGRDARRNLCMYVCAINVGLRGGDFCSLKWSDIFNEDWTFKSDAEYIPEKTKKHNKHVDLIWSKDFESAMSDWRLWNQVYGKEPELNDYIFSSQKAEHLDPKQWWRIMEKARKEAGINHKIGTHGLRKTMVNQYIKNSDDLAQGLMEMSSYLGHSDLRITERYACIEKENIKETKEKMAFITDNVVE